MRVFPGKSPGEPIHPLRWRWKTPPSLPCPRSRGRWPQSPFRWPLLPKRRFSSSLFQGAVLTPAFCPLCRWRGPEAPQTLLQAFCQRGGVRRRGDVSKEAAGSVGRRGEGAELGASAQPRVGPADRADVGGSRAVWASPPPARRPAAGGDAVTRSLCGFPPSQWEHSRILSKSSFSCWF